MPGVKHGGVRRVTVTTDAVGGVWQYAMEMSRGLVGHGWDVQLAVLGPPPDAVQLAGAPVTPVVTGLELDWTAELPGELDRASEALARLAQGSDAVLLHAPGLVGRANWPAPVVTVAHSCVGTWWHHVKQGPLPDDLAWRADATRAGLQRAAAAIAPTQAMATALHDVYGVTGLAVIHNGRSPNLAAPRQRNGILTAGRLWDEAKGAAMLDRVAARLGVAFAAAGPVRAPDGSLAAFEHLRMLGTLDEAAMATAFAGARVFASAARYEPFGLAVLEAAQAGCALVLADIPSFRELWDGVAVFVGPYDEAGWAEALTAAHADPGLGAAARAHSTRYTPAAMVAATADVLARAASRVAA